MSELSTGKRRKLSDTIDSRIETSPQYMSLEEVTASLAPMRNPAIEFTVEELKERGIPVPRHEHDGWVISTKRVIYGNGRIRTCKVYSMVKR